MVCVAQKSPPLSRNIDLMMCSPRTGENQVDTSMPMHSYRPRCAATSLFALCFRPNVFLPTCR